MDKQQDKYREYMSEPRDPAIEMNASSSAISVKPSEKTRKLLIPKELYRVNPWIFVFKLCAFGVITALCIGIIMVGHPILALLAQFALGVMFAHAVELQPQ